MDALLGEHMMHRMVGCSVSRMGEGRNQSPPTVTRGTRKVREFMAERPTNGRQEAIAKLRTIGQMPAQDSGVVYLLLEAIGAFVRAVAREKSTTLIPPDELHYVGSVIQGLSFIPTRGVAESLVADIVDFKLRDPGETTEGRTRFIAAVQELDRLWNVVAGVLHWNDVKAASFEEEGGPLRFQAHLLADLLDEELNSLRAILKERPDLRIDKDLLDRFEFVTAFFPIFPPSASS
jgi:hypothetical protein